MKKYVIITIIALFIIVAVSILIYCIDGKLRSGNVIKVSGSIEATETRLSFRVGGKIERLFVDEGNYISQGLVVAAIDDNELTKIKEQAQANLEQAQSDYKIREKEYIRFSKLLEENAVSVQDRDIAQNNYEVAAAQLEASKKALELADIRLGYANLTSTINGFVIVKSAEAGEVVQAGSPVFIVADMNDI